jgi:uncharacterized protein (DUF342 family)
LVDGAVLVEPVILVQNVNYETGHIRFDGSVVVEGSIADGFIVEAGGDIQVGNGVGKAILKAKGNILLKTGINGNGEGSITCGGDLYAKYIESCTVSCGGTVFVEEAIMHSKLSAAKHCVMNGRRSELIASDLIVGDSFWCKKLGNFNEAPTRLSIGVEPRILVDYRALKADMEKKQAEWDKAELQLEQLGKLSQDGRADERVRQAELQLTETLNRLRAELGKLRSQLLPLREKVASCRKGLVVVEDSLFKGVTILFGALEYRAPDNGARKIILKAGDRQILESGFNYNDRPKLVFDDPDGASTPDAALVESAALKESAPEEGGALGEGATAVLPE